MAEFVVLWEGVAQHFRLIAVLRVGLRGKDVVDVRVSGEFRRVRDNRRTSAVVWRGDKVNEGTVTVNSCSIVRLSFVVLLGVLGAGYNEENAENDEEENAAKDDSAKGNPLIGSKSCRIEIDEDGIHSNWSDFRFVFGPGDFGKMENSGVDHFDTKILNER